MKLLFTINDLFVIRDILFDVTEDEISFDEKKYTKFDAAFIHFWIGDIDEDGNRINEEMLQQLALEKAIDEYEMRQSDT